MRPAIEVANDCYEEEFWGIHHAAAVIQRDREELVREWADWARRRASINHRLAHENDHLRQEYMALSSAYSSIADEIEHEYLKGSSDGR